MGDVLDPIISIRKKVKIEPRNCRKYIYISSMCDSKEEVVEIAKKYNQYGQYKKSI